MNSRENLSDVNSIRSRQLSTKGMISSSTYDILGPNFKEVLGREQLRAISFALEDTHNWNFDIFAFNDSTGNHPLSVLSYALFKQARLFGSLNLNIDKFCNFVLNVEKGYQDSLPCKLFSIFSKWTPHPPYAICILHFLFLSP